MTWRKQVFKKRVLNQIKDQQFKFLKCIALGHPSPLRGEGTRMRLLLIIKQRSCKLAPFAFLKKYSVIPLVAHYFRYKQAVNMC